MTQYVHNERHFNARTTSFQRCGSCIIIIIIITNIIIWDNHKEDYIGKKNSEIEVSRTFVLNNNNAFDKDASWSTSLRNLLFYEIVFKVCKNIKRNG